MKVHMKNMLEQCVLALNTCLFAVTPGFPNFSRAAPLNSLDAAAIRNETGPVASTGDKSECREPISTHPHIPRYFLFRNSPLVLIGVMEHYGSVFNRAFDFESCLADAAELLLAFQARRTSFLTASLKAQFVFVILIRPYCNCWGLTTNV